MRIEERILKGLDFLYEQVELGTSKICVFVSVIFKCSLMFGGILDINYICRPILYCIFLNAETISYLT